MMAFFFHLSKNELSWIPGDPSRRALYLNIIAWFLIGTLAALAVGSFFEAGKHMLLLTACNLGGGFALGPGLLGGLYWWVNHDE